MARECQCYWCGEVKPRHDMLIVDGKWMCSPENTNCVEEYKDSLNTGKDGYLNTDRAQIRALGKQ